MFNRDINILVTGAKGQLGSYLVDYFTKLSLKKSSRIGKVFGIDIDDLDIRNAAVVDQFFDRNSVNPPIEIDYVIHCAAATNTSAIEAKPEDYFAVNCLGPKNIAKSCARNGIKMVFISTDYVLSEKSPIVDGDLQEFPVNQYGLQKLIAEQFVKEAYRDKPKDYMILRSSWMFGNSDNSFVEKFLKNVFASYAAKGSAPDGCKIEVPVADDAYGQPTPVWFIADTLKSLMLNKCHGTMDLHYPCCQISRYTWATMIWKAFVDGEQCIDSKTSDIIDRLVDKIAVVPRHSKDIGISMHHPGKTKISSHTIYEHEKKFGDAMTDIFTQDTSMYVTKNWLKYVEMANEMIVNRA